MAKILQKLYYCFGIGISLAKIFTSFFLAYRVFPISGQEDLRANKLSGSSS